MSPSAADGAPVTKENFTTAMADLAMQREFTQGANDTEWHHHRNLMTLDEQPTRLMNRDTTSWWSWHP